MCPLGCRKKSQNEDVTFNAKNMANEYLIDIHNYISAKIVSVKSRKAEADAEKDKALQRFYEGQLAEWQGIRDYLAEKVNLKTQKYF